VLNRWSHLTELLKSEAGLPSRTGRLLSALGLVAISPEVAAAARRNGRRNGNQERNSDQAQSKQDARAEKTPNEQKSDGKNGSNADAEGNDTGEKSGRSGKHARNEQTSGNDENSAQNASDEGKSRGDSSRRSSNSDSDSGETSASEGDSTHHSGRQVRAFAQEADDPTHGASPDHVPESTAVMQTNPNVFIDYAPDTSFNDLVVEASDDVVASVSSSGGFAFARSGDVIAVSGPDGASIIQTGDVSAGTRGTSPVEPPDDGGNNNPDYFS
jgi:hypothetical protein